MDNGKLLYKPTEAAEAIGVSRAKVYQLISEGRIPSIRVGQSIRVPIKALVEWIAREVESSSTR